MVALVRQKNLRFIREPPERRRMQHPVAVALKRASGCTVGFGVQPASRRRRACSIRRRPAFTRAQFLPIICWLSTRP
jgi:hypothetical protein